MMKSLGKVAIIEKGKEFFFPEGNRFGPVDNFIFELENFKQRKIDSRYSVGDMYESTKLPLLRFYLCAVPKPDYARATNDEELNAISSAPDAFKSMAGSSSMTRTVTTADMSPNGLEGSTCMSHRGSTENVSTEVASHSPVSPAADCSKTVFKLPPCTSVQDVLDEPQSFQFIIEKSDETLNPESLFGNPKTPVTSSPTVVNLGTPTVQSRADLLSAGNVLDETMSPVRSLPIPNDLMNDVDDQVHPVAVVANVAEDEPSNDTNTPVQKLKLHKGHVLKELIEFYNKTVDDIKTLEVQMIIPNGTIEAAEDCGGVLRDTLSEFWEDFYSLNTTDENVKVPCIRDNMKKQDWQACAKVLVLGYKKEGYFPYKLALPFLQFTMDGDDTLVTREHESLLPAFLEYVSVSERDLFEVALKNFSEVDNEALLEVLETYKVKRCVRADNVEDILKDAAHRTLIQATAYICSCWHPFFVNNLRPILKGSLTDVCKQALPTTKRVIDAQPSQRS
ncbi:uncharacterized protein LOC121386748 [Gigantopelta aegis]|uniref:uncharacterized protein LOC121386748 n=1 Tax=Gigantopelta aegis TaxID=1735272 RepID=UPI001B88E0A8|nr:uncharacterized protein LOC121386748 [Gigantopelta aegis]